MSRVTLIDGIDVKPGDRVLLVNADARTKWRQWLWKFFGRRSLDGLYTVREPSRLSRRVGSDLASNVPDNGSFPRVSL